MAKQVDISVVLVGEKGAGKTRLYWNLTNNIFDEHLNTIFYEHPTLQKPNTSHTEISTGVNLQITDTVGLQIHTKKTFRELYRHIKGKVDMFLYCISIFQERMISIHDTMKSLQEVFGKNIWNRCIIVFTFSDGIYDAKHVDNYRTYINPRAHKIQKELRKLNAHINVKPVLGFDPTRPDPNTILAIPAGSHISGGPVLLDPHTSGHEVASVANWKAILLIEIIRMYDAKLLQYCTPEIAAVITGALYNI